MMTVATRELARSAAPTQLGIVDCDTHNCWDSVDELRPYLAGRWFDQIGTIGLRHYAGGGYPRFWADKAPPSGRRPGADVAFMGTDHLDANGISYAILIPLTPVTGMPNLEFAGALARAINDWQAAEWLDADPRMRASIIVPTEDPVAAAAEIRRVARDRRFVQVQFSGRPQEPMGRRRYWPIYEACAEDHVDPPQAMQANVISLVFEGVFEKFPGLNLLSVESGFGWAGPLMWRMDNAWKALPEEVPHLQKPPSAYMTEHVYFATQPVEEPPKREYFAQLFDQYPALADRLLFSSDYPHWDGDDPARALPELRDRELRDKVLRLNARRLYRLS
jgi:predicted TIM-barrel fold metal-dependent hydrolase